MVAVDVSPAMLAVARDRAAAGLANIECVQAGFLSYQHTGPLLEPMLTAAGLDIVAADFDRQVCGAYTCVKR